MEDINILVIIPARGGSRGIPRKNLRALNHKPLIYYSIKTALKSRFSPDVFVSSDDEEILMFAERFGANIIHRDNELADNKTTLEPVIYNAYKLVSSRNSKKYDLVITIQPTSPLLTSITLDKAIERIISNLDIDVIISVKEKKHLSWRNNNGSYVPNYKKRLNRQQLDAMYEETGSFVICRSKNLVIQKKRITGNIDLYNLPKKEAIDIDDYDDWALCEFYLKRKRILFVLTGNHQTGLGHIYRSIILGYGILNHEVIFLVEKDSKLGYDKLKSYYFEVHIQKYNDIIDDIRELKPDLVINDKLDTTKDYILSLRQIVPRIMNFEDIGSGAPYADIVINALYPENKSIPNHYYGYEYFCARDEFLNSDVKIIGDMKNILISFGGVDPDNLTYKVVGSIYKYCYENKIQITVVEGIGYESNNSLKKFDSINVVRNVKNISDYFLNADIIYTSAGRTVYEIACIGTPTIVMAQNERELTHFFANAKTGFVNLGLGRNVKQQTISYELNVLAENEELRKEMNRKMLSFDLRSGKKKTISLINYLIEK
jgi:CMP-N-acetylneuraminic acid synthetase